MPLPYNCLFTPKMHKSLVQEINTTLLAAKALRAQKGMGSGYGMTPSDLTATTLSNKYNISKIVAKKMIQEARPNANGLNIYTNSLSTIPTNRFAGGSFGKMLKKGVMKGLKVANKVLKKTKFVSSLGIPGVSQAARVFGYGSFSRGGCSPLTFGNANMYKGGRRSYAKFPNMIGMGSRRALARRGYGKGLKNIYN